MTSQDISNDHFCLSLFVFFVSLWYQTWSTFGQLLVDQVCDWITPIHLRQYSHIMHPIVNHRIINNANKTPIPICQRSSMIPYPYVNFGVLKIPTVTSCQYTQAKRPSPTHPRHAPVLSISKLTQNKTDGHPLVTKSHRSTGLQKVTTKASQTSAK